MQATPGGAYARTRALAAEIEGLDIDPEKAVLGSILRDNDCLDDVLLSLRAEDFRTVANQTIFAAMMNLHRQAKPIDSVTLTDFIHKDGNLEKAGGYAHIASLLQAVLDGGNAVWYASQVADDSMGRAFFRHGQRVVGMCQNPEAPIKEMVGTAERELFEIMERRVEAEAFSLDTCVGLVFDRLDAIQANDLSMRGIPSGLLDLDDVTGGFKKSDLIIIGARPSVGKTAFALNIARHVCLDLKIPVFFASLEQSKTDLAERIILNEALVDSYKIRTNQLGAEDLEKLIKAGGEFRRAPMWIDDKSNQSLTRIAAMARRQKRRNGIQLLIVDYLQLIEPESSKLPRQEQVSGISRRLKSIAKDLDIPVIVLCQVNRSPEGRADKCPKLSDLRESGAIEADADLVLLLHNEDQENKAANPLNPCSVLHVVVAKHRNGPTDMIKLAFQKAFMRFENYAEFK